MIRLIIVDDEDLEREGLTSIVDWDGLGITVIGAYKNGKEALEAVRQDRPDIVLSDIYMPIMDGLKMGEYISEEYPEIKLIFLSGYDEFEYAKKAVDLNAVKYLLKPFKVEEIESVLHDVVKQCAVEKSNVDEYKQLKRRVRDSLPSLQQKLCNDLIRGYYQFEDEITIQKCIAMYELPLELTGNYAVCHLDMEELQLLTAHKPDYYSNLLMLDVLDFINFRIRSENRGIAIHIGDFEFVIIFSFKTCESYVEFIELLTDKVRKHFPCTVTVGLGNLVQKLSLIYSSHRQAKEALAHKFLFGVNQVICFSDLGKQDTMQIDLLVEQIKDELVTLVEKGDEDKIREKIGLLTQSFSMSDLEKEYIQSVCIDIINSLSRYLLSIDVDMDKIFGDDISIIGKLLKIHTLHDVNNWLGNIIVCVSQHLEQRNTSRCKLLVQKMKEIIEQRYAEDLNVADIASEVYFSAGYAGMIFKRETGESIMRYLIKTRVNKAKELLCDPNIKVFEVAYAIGYNNLAYFTALFKSEVGMSPKEYQNKNSKN